MAKASTLIGKINGKNTYRRVAIRRRRYPISQPEAERLEQYQKNYHVSDAELGRKACDISNMGGYEFAGKIFSYLDSKKNACIDEILGGGE